MYFLSKYLTSGWNLGRYFSDNKLKEIGNSISKGLKGKTLGRHLTKEQRDYISERTKECLREHNVVPSNKGKIAINDGNHIIYINKEELNMYLEKGFKLGYPKRKEVI